MLIIATLLVTLILIRQLSTVAMMWKVNGIFMLPHLIVLTLLLVFASCTKEDLKPPTCTDGDCNGYLELPYPIDENGYYHVDLSWDGQYYPRFSIDTYAEPTDPYWWYNETPVVQANFYTENTWTFQHDELPVVQNNRIYLSKNENSSNLYGKRIVGPIPPQMEGDTLNIKAVIFWDAGINYVEKEISLKIIVE
jgi:hypothetical protein